MIACNTKNTGIGKWEVYKNVGEGKDGREEGQHREETQKQKDRRGIPKGG